MSNKLLASLIVSFILLTGCASSTMSNSPTTTSPNASNQPAATPIAALSTTAAPVPTVAISPSPVTISVPTQTMAPQEANPAPTTTPIIEKASVKIISVTSPAARNSTATLKAKVKPGATASIEVHYKSGASKAEGLKSKKADDKGNVSWSWHVGGRTTLGSWPITVSSDGGSAETEFEVVH
ncbi:hypothetical protein [Paenibacillus sp. SI8]|uniref:hypothetical protein n=1 Tax=unclassified Paenibacillus TaxID=185978 RepID=UPI003465D329